MPKFYSQWNPASGRGICTGSDSLVSRVPVLSNSARIGQMMLTGMQLDANRVGYDYRHDEALPESITVRPGRTSDVVELMDYISVFGARLREAVSTYNAQPEPGADGKDGKVTQPTPPTVPGAPATAAASVDQPAKPVE